MQKKLFLKTYEMLSFDLTHFVLVVIKISQRASVRNKGKNGKFKCFFVFLNVIIKSFFFIRKFPKYLHNHGLKSQGISQL